jgi:hypothetical protein
VNEPTFHVRERIPLGEPTNTSGSRRPLLRLLLPWHSVHYNGIEPRQMAYSGGDGVFDTIEDAFAHVRRLEEIARASGKPYEYNTLIPVMADPQAAHVIAYADEYQAAHSAGENADAHGTQFMAGIGQRLSPGAIHAMRWWHAVLLATGRLAPGVGLTRHRDMPDAATACPGYAIDLDWDAITVPWSPTQQEETLAMLKRYRDRRYHNIWLIPHKLHLSGEADAAYAADGVPLVEGQHEQMLDDLLHASGLTRDRLVPR